MSNHLIAFESKNIKGHNQYSQNRQMSHLTEGGEL